ncbi:MAG TPA: BON domain-containing protein [Burkholderiales bacterium]|nr:BON domain-containing protein [Burkholderiales bacterium]
MKACYQRMVRCFITTGVAFVLLDGCDARHDGRTPVVGATAEMEKDDSVITANVSVALREELPARSGYFNVETRNGKVYLSGYVDNKNQVDRAISIARGLEGVKDVESNVRMAGEATLAGHKIDDGVTVQKNRPGLLNDGGLKRLDIGVPKSKDEVQRGGFLDN